MGVSTGVSIQDEAKAYLFVIGDAVSASLFHVFAMLSLQYLPASRYQIISGSYVLFAAGLSVLFGDTLGYLGLVGLLTVAAGVVLVASGKNRAARRPRKYDFTAILAALSVATALVFFSKATEYSSNGFVLLVSSMLQALMLGIAAALTVRSKTKMIRPDWRHAVPFMILGAINALIGWAYLLAQNNAPSIGLLTTTTSLTIPLTALAAIVLLGERQDLRRKIIGSLFVFAGVLLFSIA